MSKSVPQAFVLALCLQLAGLTQGHVVITYPGWRGNNLGRTDEFPFGMQWMYPCACWRTRGDPVDDSLLTILDTPT